MSAPRALRDGVVASLVVAPSVFVYGTVFGGLAVQAGLRTIETLGMSLLVFAGAAQFAAVPMLGAGASPLTIVLTTDVLNKRPLPLAAPPAPGFRRLPPALVAPGAHGVD